MNNHNVQYTDNDIILVNPTGGWDQHIESKYFFPIGLLYLQNYLLKYNIPSTIIDVKPQGLSPDAFKQLIKEYKPKIIGFTGSPFERHSLHEYINGIKKFIPNSLVIVGGPYFTATAKECLTYLQDVDVVVRGEGELTLLELVRLHASGSIDYKKIKSITFRDESGNIIENENRLPLNRDECEIDIELIQNNNVYSPFVHLKNFEKEKIHALPILLARGCIKRCTFCFNNNSRFSSRAISSIIREIQVKREKFQCDYFWMVDPTFTMREKYAYELCEALQKYCPGIKWYCETRADCSLDLLNEMSKSGCISIDFALESGSAKVLKAIRKDLDPSLVVQFAKECKKLGIRALVFVMYSLPEETMEDFRRTMRILKEIKSYIYDISYNQTLILPGTQLEKQALSLNLLPTYFSWYKKDFVDVPAWKTLLSNDEIDKCRRTLDNYRLSLYYSKVQCLRRQLKRDCIESLSKNKTIVNLVKRNQKIHKILLSLVRIIFGSDK